jgi:hypothetical protein
MTTGNDRQPERNDFLDALGDRLEADDYHAREAARARQEARARRRPILAGAFGLLVILAAVAAPLVHWSSRASAAPDKAAEAASRAGSFAFTTDSDLRFPGHPPALVTVVGEVDVRHHAFRVQVIEGGSGFERVVFPKAIYVRHLGRISARTWLGARLAPEVTIGVNTGAGGGLGDPLGLLAFLMHAHATRLPGEPVIRGQATRHYVLSSTAGALLAFDGATASPRIAAIPMTIEVWQDHQERLQRAVRTFNIPGRATLRVTTEFSHYGKPTKIEAPKRIPLGPPQELNPFAYDPVGAGVLSTLAVATQRPTTPSVSTAQTPRPHRNTRRPGHPHG